MLGFVRLLNILSRFKVCIGLIGKCFVFQHISYCQPLRCLPDRKSLMLAIRYPFRSSQGT